ncbi:MAG: c-type cytochrome [Ginsengibacter sp.]
MKKSFLVIITCVASVFVFQAFTTPPVSNWKNLKILPKDISEDGLDSVMHHFTASLNVKCNYCHVRNNDTKKMDFPNDDKPEKLIARKMMLLAIDINKNHFREIEADMEAKDGKVVVENESDSVNYMLKYVTCYTCHHGNEHPENKPPKKEESPKP